MCGFRNNYFSLQLWMHVCGKIWIKVKQSFLCILNAVILKVIVYRSPLYTFDCIYIMRILLLKLEKQPFVLLYIIQPTIEYKFLTILYSSNLNSYVAIFDLKNSLPFINSWYFSFAVKTFCLKHLHEVYSHYALINVNYIGTTVGQIMLFLSDINVRITVYTCLRVRVFYSWTNKRAQTEKLQMPHGNNASNNSCACLRCLENLRMEMSRQ